MCPWVISPLRPGFGGGWEHLGLAGRRQVLQAGEEHGSPGRRCGSGITGAGKALLAGAGVRRGLRVGKGLGRRVESHPEPWDSPPIAGRGRDPA